MAGCVNKVILVGNLGKDPEARQMNDGREFVNFSLATSDSWRDQQGERRERTEWHRVVIFNQRLAEVARRYLRKGSKVYLEGQLQTRKWTDQQGIDKYSTEVILGQFRGELTMLDTRSGGGSGSGGYGEVNQSRGQVVQETWSSEPVQSMEADPSPSASSPGDDYSKDLDDDVPF